MKSSMLLYLLLIPFMFACGSEEVKEYDDLDARQHTTETDFIEGNNAEESFAEEAVKEYTDDTLEFAHVITRFGDIYIRMHNETPKHKENFLQLVKEGFYDNTTFHRIIDGFMIQGGDPNSKDDDPTNDGQGGPGYTIPAEINPALTHQYGAVAAARMPDQVNPEKRSSGSQFFIVENPAGTRHLDGGYTVFGQVVEGMEVVEKIAIQPKGPRDRPVEDITMEIKVLQLTPEQAVERFGEDAIE